MLLEDIIKDMGFAFRDLVYHSDGTYSCRLGYDFMRNIKGPKEFWGGTPLEAVSEAQTALALLDSQEPETL